MTPIEQAKAAINTELGYLCSMNKRQTNGEKLRVGNLREALTALSTIEGSAEPVAWKDAETIANMANVHDALKDFSYDPTDTNGILLVRTIIEHSPSLSVDEVIEVHSAIVHLMGTGVTVPTIEQVIAHLTKAIKP